MLRDTFVGAKKERQPRPLLRPRPRGAAEQHLAAPLAGRGSSTASTASRASSSGWSFLRKQKLDAHASRSDCCHWPESAVMVLPRGFGLWTLSVHAGDFTTMLVDSQIRLPVSQFRARLTSTCALRAPRCSAPEQAIRRLPKNKRLPIDVERESMQHEKTAGSARNGGQLCPPEFRE